MTPEINRISADLEAAQADLELAERLNTAKARVERLTVELNDAKASQASAAGAAREKRLDSVSDVRITWTEPSGLWTSQNLLGRHFSIKWIDCSLNPSKERSCVGFHSLPQEVLEHLVYRTPDRLPAEILALRPGDPANAVRDYFMALKRGYVRLKAGATT